MNKLIALCCLFAMICTAAPASAQEFQNMKPFGQSELNNFLGDWPEFSAWAQEKGEEYGDNEEYQWGKAAEAKVRGMGWEPERFFYIAHQCAIGITGLAMDEQGPEIDSQLAEARASVMNDPSLSPEQRQMMLDMLAQSQSSMSDLDESRKNIPPQEMVLIKANEDRIRKALQVEE